MRRSLGTIYVMVKDLWANLIQTIPVVSAGIRLTHEGQ